MQTLNLKANHKAVRDYYDAIQNLAALGATYEGAVSPAFAALLRHCASQFEQTLVEKFPIKHGGHTIFVDGAVLDAFKLRRGVWEAKDTHDDLEKEVKKKFDAGYPKDNTLFQAPNHIILWQNGKEVFNEDVSKPEHLVEVLSLFFQYQPPAYEQWQEAVEEFRFRVRELANGLLQLIEEERSSNTLFVQAFETFSSVCRQTINPNISVAAIEEMLIQHVLTERIFRKVFNNPDFVERNVIAKEIEKVIQALTSKYFSRDDFLKSLDRFYVAIETTAATIDDFSQKQAFLNTVYEKFFQGFSVKVADTHGIVYTPQPIVSFMVKSVEEILRQEFGRSLSDEGVHIIDPFVGTGNFIVRIMREISETKKSKLPYKYAHEIHCNEVMLLPYYIASMNIEHEFYELVGSYQPFDAICLVDTFELAEGKQLSLFTEENTARVKRQQSTPIFVIIGNPPYNAGQVNENDNNKNRKYPAIDKRIASTYARDSRATYVADLSDPYVKALRWASDRILQNGEGIVALVTNSNYLEGIAFDGVRKHLAGDFDVVYVLDLGGNVRKTPRISGTTHNVFGIQVGVCISFLVKREKTPTESARLYYASVDEYWRKEQKYGLLDQKVHYANIDLEELEPDTRYNWLTHGMSKRFEEFLPMGTVQTKRSRGEAQTVFRLFSLGVGTNRDAHVYSFHKENLRLRVAEFIDIYNAAVDKLGRTGGNPSDLVDVNDGRIKWTYRTKASLIRLEYSSFIEGHIRNSMYRPFTKQYLYYDAFWNERQYQTRHIFPTLASEAENLIICVPSPGSKQIGFFMTNVLPDLNFFAGSTPIQCFPFYVYDRDGGNRRENVTDWALEQFRLHYGDEHITKWDIFTYVYGVLHHTMYHNEYSTNLKRELPRIPFAPDFWGFAKAGTRMSELHVNYEKQAEYPLERVESKDVSLNWRVEKMRLSEDKGQLVYNEFLTFCGIPSAAYEYRLGNRSAVEWVIDQYQTKAEKRTGIRKDPNRKDDSGYIARLIGKIVTVSLETVEVVRCLPSLE
ncbi:type ISP restriction/modification enzyme [Chloroflexota bacterium]